MVRSVYVNGEYLPYSEAMVHVEDRGFQFGDAVYEVCEIYRGRLIDLGGHLARLARSMRELQMTPPMSEAALKTVLRETVRRNHVRDGLIYLQVTRGEAPRDFFFPAPDTPSTLVVIARSVPRWKGEAQSQKGIRVATMRDMRWKRPDIKTTLLLPQVLARAEARNAGASEAWLVDDDGWVTEGAASNAWILTSDDVLITRPSNTGILKGITRETILNLAARTGFKIEKRKFTVAEAQAAREAFVTAATALVMPVVAIDGVPVSDGRPGTVTLSLRRGLHDAAQAWS